MSFFSRSGKDKAVRKVKIDGGGTIRGSKNSSEMRLRRVQGAHDRDVRRSTLESDRKSQLSTQELVIRKDVCWEVTRAAAEENNDARYSG